MNFEQLRELVLDFFPAETLENKTLLKSEILFLMVSGNQKIGKFLISRNKGKDFDNFKKGIGELMTATLFVANLNQTSLYEKNEKIEAQNEPLRIFNKLTGHVGRVATDINSSHFNNSGFSVALTNLIHDLRVSASTENISVEEEFKNFLRIEFEKREKARHDLTQN